MRKTITLTEKMLRLIKFIRFEEFDLDDKESFNELKRIIKGLKLVDDLDPEIDLKDSSRDLYDTYNEMNAEKMKEIDEYAPNNRMAWGIDQYNMFGGTYLLEDMALILGYWDKFIPGTEEDPRGRRYPEEIENEMYELYDYICENLVFIESLIHFMSTEGGVKPGTYTCTDSMMDWELVNKVSENNISKE